MDSPISKKDAGSSEDKPAAAAAVPSNSLVGQSSEEARAAVMAQRAAKKAAKLAKKKGPASGSESVTDIDTSSAASTAPPTPTTSNATAPARGACHSKLMPITKTDKKWSTATRIAPPEDPTLPRTGSEPEDICGGLSREELLEVNGSKELDSWWSTLHGEALVAATMAGVRFNAEKQAAAGKDEDEEDEDDDAAVQEEKPASGVPASIKEYRFYLPDGTFPLRHGLTVLSKLSPSSHRFFAKPLYEEMKRDTLIVKHLNLLHPDAWHMTLTPLLSEKRLKRRLERRQARASSLADWTQACVEESRELFAGLWAAQTMLDDAMDNTLGDGHRVLKYSAVVEGPHSLDKVKHAYGALALRLDPGPGFEKHIREITKSLQDSPVGSGSIEGVWQSFHLTVGFFNDYCSQDARVAVRKAVRRCIWDAVFGGGSAAAHGETSSDINAPTQLPIQVGLTFSRPDVCCYRRRDVGATPVFPRDVENYEAEVVAAESRRLKLPSHEALSDDGSPAPAHLPVANPERSTRDQEDSTPLMWVAYAVAILAAIVGPMLGVLLVLQD